MTKSSVSLGAAVVLVIAAFSLPAVADTSDQPAKPTVAVKKHPKKHYSLVAQPVRSAPAQGYVPPGCTWPYTNQYPPCQSTWPAGSPNYHGSSHPGPSADH